MNSSTTAPVLLVQQSRMLRRILRLNLEAEGIAVDEADSPAACRERMLRGRPAAVVLDPRMFHDPHEAAAVYALLRHSNAPLLVLSDAPELRSVTRSLGGAPFCNRPDDMDRVILAVRDLLNGAAVPALV